MVINRTSLLQELYEFALADNGLVVGKPGIGKSYLLQGLKTKLLDNKILAFIIRIDNTYNFSDEAIQAELGLESDWIAKFKKIQLQNEFKAVLIFDAFDAARDETLRKGFLSQIRRAQIQLGDKWNILVSVRTYDAGKSPELIKMFPDPRYSATAKISRQFTVENLKEEEVKSVLSIHPGLLTFYETSSSELKEILHTPFFLEILEKISLDANAQEMEAIKKFKSETQLLNTYWEKKIIGTTDQLFKEQVLAALSNQLVASRSLSCNRTSFLGDRSAAFLASYQILRSDGLLDEVSINQSRIAFAHNILFDFAVSYFCLDEDYQHFIEFMEGDLTRPFFLRPSFIYFLTTLWYQKNAIFWDFYWKLLDNPKKEVQLFHRLVLNGILASEYSSVGDLAPVINSNKGKEKPEIIRNVLQSIRFLRSKSTAADIDLLADLSLHLDPNFLFEFGFLMDRAVCDLTEHPEFRNSSGQSARNMMRYIFQARLTEAKEYVDRIGAQRGIDLVARTYDTDKKASYEAILPILAILNEPGFNINWFTFLAESVKFILSFDPEMVAKIYEAIFGYTETSSEQTSMGVSVVMNFMTNRIQDFEMCYYRLKEFYPEFLTSSPELAIKTGLKIVNDYIINDRLGYAGEAVPVEFSYNGQPHYFISDHSSLWADRDYEKPTEMAGDIFAYIKEVFDHDKQGAGQALVALYIEHAKTGFTWKLLLKFAAGFPDQLHEIIYPLLVTPVIMRQMETSFEVREIVEGFQHKFSDKQIKTIEELMIALYKDADPVTLSRALSRIASKRLQSDEAKKFMQENVPVENEPSISFHSSVTTYTTDKWLEERGVDFKISENQGLMDLIAKMETFSNQWLNDVPDAPVYTPFLEDLANMFGLLENEAKKYEEDLYFSALTSAVKVASIISKDYKNLPAKDFTLIAQLIKKGFSYHSKFDREDSANSSPSSGWSPTPRIEASEGIVNLYNFEQSDSHFDLLSSAVNDKNSVIRFNAVKGIETLFSHSYDGYNSLIEERLKAENSSFIYAILLGNLIFKIVGIQEKATTWLKLVNKKLPDFAEHDTFLSNYADLLLYLVNHFDLPIAVETLQNAYDRPKFCNTVIFRLFEKMHPSWGENKYDQNPNLYSRELSIIQGYIERTDKCLARLKPEQVTMEDPAIKNSLMVLDKIVQRIYFLMQPKSLNRNTFQLPVNESSREAFYFKIKPMLKSIITVSGNIAQQGLIIGHTAHYFIQLLNDVLDYDPKDILEMVVQVTRHSVAGRYTTDSQAVAEMVKITEKLLADHRGLLLEDGAFQNLLDLLDMYITTGWPAALELLWKLDEIFK